MKSAWRLNWSAPRTDAGSCQVCFKTEEEARSFMDGYEFPEPGRVNLDEIAIPDLEPDDLIVWALNKVNVGTEDY